MMWSYALVQCSLQPSILIAIDHWFLSDMANGNSGGRGTENIHLRRTKNQQLYRVKQKRTFSK